MRIIKASGRDGFREAKEQPFIVRWRSVIRVGDQPWLPTLLELLVVLGWTVFITRSFLNFDPRMVPSGPEYPMEVQGHLIWTWFRQCGLCVLWDGSTCGGHPAFVDVHGSILHPLVVVFTLALGVINGSKLALVGVFFIAGLAQWWMAKELQTGLVSRIFTACLAVAAGNLAGRMSQGVYAVVMSTAASTLVIAALVALGRRGSWRAAVALGVSVALAAVSGQGYIQIGLLFILPAILLLVPWGQPAAGVMMRRLAWAGILAGLLAGVLLVPLIHFLPQFGKALDPTFVSAQPFAFVPLNLVINEHDLATKGALHTLPYPYLYENYIGWAPVLLAVYGLGGHKPAWKRRVTAFLAISIVLIFWVASASPLRLLIRVLPIQTLINQIAGIRYPSLIAGIAVPLVLALAALGLDRLYHLRWPTLRLVVPDGERTANLTTLNLQWLLVLPLLLSLNSARAFGAPWLTTRSIDAAETSAVIQALKTPDLQWVNPPFGELYFLLPAIEQGLKLGYGAQPWYWINRPLPEAVLEAARNGVPPDMELLTSAGGVPIYQGPAGRAYAAVTHSDQSQTICSAQGLGGDVDVECNLRQAGLLTVEENSWPGWNATVDGQPVPLDQGRWLAVNLPAGHHVVSFRYRPWDVLIGSLLTCVGLVLAGYMWLKRCPTRSAESETDQAGVLDTSATEDVVLD